MYNNFPAQVAAVFDTDGKIRPRWVRFRSHLGELITLNDLTIEKENRDNAPSKVFMCSTYMYGRKYSFCISYHYREHAWILLYRNNAADYDYLFS